MEKLEEYLAPSNYKLWLSLGIVALTAGFLIAGFGEIHKKILEHFNIIGDLLRGPGGILVTTSIVIAGLTSDELSNGVRVAALICGGLLAMLTF